MKHYIQWKYVDSEYINIDEYKEKVKYLEEHGKQIVGCKTVAKVWFENELSYAIDTKGYTTTIYVAKKAEFGHDLRRYKMHRYKSKEDYKQREENDIYPSECRKEIANLFREYNGCTLCKAFHCVSSAEYKNLVPKPVYYIDRKYANKTIDVQYIDITSTYPSHALGKLPDAATAITVQGRVSPSEEYPFAFYMKSNHCAEYNVFDTHDYLNLPRDYYFFQCFTNGKPIYNMIPDEEEETVLMKASKYELTQVFEEVMRRKNEEKDPLAKAICNIGIGTLHPNPENQGKDELRAYYHICAIIIGRVNRTEYDMARKIEKNGKVVEMVVDSIVYFDFDDVNYGTDTKVPGKFYNEFHKPTLKFRSADAINKFVIADEDGNLLKVVVSGVEKDKQDVKCLEDIDKYNLKEKKNKGEK